MKMFCERTVVTCPNFEVGHELEDEKSEVWQCILRTLTVLYGRETLVALCVNAERVGC